LYSLLPKAQGLLGVDSAPLHLAAMVNRALATPQSPNPLRVMGLYGPTLASRTGPGAGGGDTLHLPHGILPCQPCHKKRCLLLPTTTTTAVAMPAAVEHAPCLQRLEPQQVLQWVHWQGWEEALMDLELPSLDATL
jgi:ADP-heptose:LPS heptosyltransferase